MIEKNVHIKKKIPGILTLPGKNFFDKSKAVIMLHGFASDKNESGCKNAYRILANQLAEKNIISLRIDFSGWGQNLSILQEESTIETMIADAIHSFEYLKDLLANSKINIGYVGFSLGAAISIIAANRLNHSCNFLGLLSPVGNLPKDFESFLGEKNYNSLIKCTDKAEIKLSWTNIKLGKAFADSLYKYDIQQEILGQLIPIICIAGSDDFSAVHAKNFINKSSKKNSKLIIYENTDHCFNAFNKKIKLYEAMHELSKWIKKLN